MEQCVASHWVVIIQWNELGPGPLHRVHVVDHDGSLFFDIEVELQGPVGLQSHAVALEIYFQVGMRKTIILHLDSTVIAMMIMGTEKIGGVMSVEQVVVM